MKSPKLEKKLTLKKLTVSSLDNIKGGDIATNPCIPTQVTCYQYSCAGWSRCPDRPC